MNKERNWMYVDGQAVVLKGGQEANISLEWDEDSDIFRIVSDCDNWEDNYRDFMRDYYPNDEVDETLIKEAHDDCRKMSGEYFTLWEINRVFEMYCNEGDWYEFYWEYDDGTPVE